MPLARRSAIRGVGAGHGGRTHLTLQGLLWVFWGLAFANPSIGFTQVTPELLIAEMFDGDGSFTSQVGGGTVIGTIALDTNSDGFITIADIVPIVGQTPTCARDATSEAIALERELVTRGRADADFEHAVGSDSAELLDAADALRTKLVEEAAADLGAELPVEEPAGSCSGAAGVERQGVSAQTLSDLQLAMGGLKLLVQAAPVRGTTPSDPYTDQKSGTAADGSPTQTVTSINLLFSGHDSTVEVMVTSSTSVTAHGTTTTESATIIASLNVCPDSGGLARGNVVVVLDGAVTDVASYHAESSQYVDFVVNDAAHVASVELTSTLEYRATGAHAADVAVSGTGTLAPGTLKFTQHDEKVDRNNGSSSDAEAFARDLYKFGHWVAQEVQDAAERKWRGGTCIEVRADPTSEMVLADAEVTITATPRHKFDMSNVEAPVVATLMGVASVSPEGQPVRAPASFQYVAGSKFKDLGVVKLKSTSKRGIGEATSMIQVKCDEDMMCPEGKTLNLETCMCECPDQECPAGQTWDSEACRCVCLDRTCPAGMTQNPQTCECVCNRACPPGQTLNEDTCQCEASCDIDPMLGNRSYDCKWVGRVQISAHAAGEAGSNAANYTRHISWELSYDASLQVADSAPFLVRLKGGVAGTYLQVYVDMFPAPFNCTSTDTRDVSVTSELDNEGTLSIEPRGDGMFDIRVDLYTKGYLLGTETLERSSSACGQNESYMQRISIGTFVGSGTATRTVLSGTTSDAYPEAFLLPDQSYASFDLSFSLSLVKR